jgi:GAF domain-containing protein
VPCIDVVAAGQGVITKSEDLFNEPRWHALALASAAAGVRSTLTFPIMNGDEVIGTVNLYGRSDDTFSGKHAALADVFGAWAPGAVMNADMSFSTRLRAEGAPAQLREDALIDAATGILAAHHKIPVEDARETLEQAAARAGLPLTALARTNHQAPGLRRLNRLSPRHCWAGGPHFMFVRVGAVLQSSAAPG